MFPGDHCLHPVSLWSYAPNRPPTARPTCTPLPPSQLRHLWKHYYSEMSVGVVIFVVDGNDASRLPAGEIDEDARARVCVCVCVCVCV